MRSQWRCPSPLLLVLLIASMLTLGNCRWCGHSRMLWVIGLAGWRMMKSWLLPYSKAMETLIWWPSAACLPVWAQHWGELLCVPPPALRHCLSEGCGVGGCTSGTSVSQASGESTVWAQAARFTPFASCPLSFCIPHNENFFSLALYFRGPPISSRYFSALLKNINLNHGRAFWASDWISKCCFPVTAILWVCCFCSLTSLAAELSLFLSEADMLYYFIFHLLVCLE